MSNKLKEVQDLIKKLSKDELTQQKQLFQKRKEIRENLLALYESFNMWLNQMDLKKMSDTYQHNINLVNNLLKNKNLVDGMQVDLREIVTDVMKKMEELAWYRQEFQQTRMFMGPTFNSSGYRGIAEDDWQLFGCFGAEFQFLQSERGFLRDGDQTGWNDEEWKNLIHQLPKKDIYDALPALLRFYYQRNIEIDEVLNFGE
jgi:hypothetical protein